jgi:secreted trypsin-like serine protease
VKITKILHVCFGSFKCIWSFARSGALSACRQTYYNNDECCNQDETEKAQCGTQISSHSRIYGGNRTSINNWPWLVAMFLCKNGNCKVCGGSFIGQEWIVTAAHCIDHFHPRYSRIIAGANEFDAENRPIGQNYSPAKYEIVSSHIHPGYRTEQGTPLNDIAMLRVKPLEGQSNTFPLSPVCLPSGEATSAGKRCWVAGYGKLNYNDQMPDFKLSEAFVPIASDSDCLAAYDQANVKTMICAGYPDGKADACTMDSGGPLVCQRCESCSFYLAGVVSFGKGCGQTYGVYTSVLEFEEWINSLITVSRKERKSCPVKKACDAKCKSLTFLGFHFFESNHVSPTGQIIYKDYQLEKYLVPMQDRSGNGFSGWVVSESPAFSWEKPFSHYVTASGYRNELQCPDSPEYSVFDRATNDKVSSRIICSELLTPPSTTAPPTTDGTGDCCQQITITGFPGDTGGVELSIRSTSSDKPSFSNADFSLYFDTKLNSWLFGRQFDMSKTICYSQKQVGCPVSLESVSCVQVAWKLTPAFSITCNAKTKAETTTKQPTTLSTTNSPTTSNSKETKCCQTVQIRNHLLSLPGELFFYSFPSSINGDFRPICDES